MIKKTKFAHFWEGGGGANGEKIDWSPFYTDNAFREKRLKNPYIAKRF